MTLLGGRGIRGSLDGGSGEVSEGKRRVVVRPEEGAGKGRMFLHVVVGPNSKRCHVM
jgi:hypothetical protein